MNLPLHLGLLGIIEAGLIAFAVGVLAWLVWRWLARRFALSDGQAIGRIFSSRTLSARHGGNRVSAP